MVLGTPAAENSHVTPLVFIVSLVLGCELLKVHSPYVSVHGGGAHDAVGDGDDALHGLGFDGEAVARGAEAVPVEDIDGSLAGAAHHLLPSFHQRHGRQVPALHLRLQLEPPSLYVEHAHCTVTTADHTRGVKRAFPLSLWCDTLETTVAIHKDYIFPQCSQSFLM